MTYTRPTSVPGKWVPKSQSVCSSVAERDHPGAVQAKPEPKATPRSIEWSEIGHRGFWHTVFPLHEQSRVTVARENALLNKISAARVLRCLVLIPTFGYGAVWELMPCTGDFQRRRKPCG